MDEKPEQARLAKRPRGGRKASPETKQPKRGKGAQVLTRVTLETRLKLEAEADRTGRSLSQVAELAIESALEDWEVNRGPQGRDTAELCGKIARFIAQTCTMWGDLPSRDRVMAAYLEGASSALIRRHFENLAPRPKPDGDGIFSEEILELRRITFERFFEFYSSLNVRQARMIPPEEIRPDRFLAYLRNMARHLPADALGDKVWVTGQLTGEEALELLAPFGIEVTDELQGYVRSIDELEEKLSFGRSLKGGIEASAREAGEGDASDHGSPSPSHAERFSSVRCEERIALRIDEEDD